MAPLLAPSKKDLPLFFSYANRRLHLNTQLKGELTDFFLKITRVFPIPTGRVGIGWWPLPQVRDSLEDKSMIVYSKKTFSPFSLSRNRIYLGTHLKDELTDLFWKLPRYSLFPHRQSCKSRQRMMNTLLMVNINLTCNR